MNNAKPIIGIVLVIVALGAIMHFIQSPPTIPILNPTPTPSPTPPPATPIAQTDLTKAWPTLLKNAASPTALGNPKAPYTMLEIGDFQCPSCGRAEPEVMQTLNESNGKAKLYFYNFPIPSAHPHAMIAAQAGLSAAAQGKFWPMYQMMYGNQDSLIDSEIEFSARSIPGMNVQKLTDDLSKGTYIPTINNQIKIVTSVKGIDSVPILLIRDPKGHFSIYEGAKPTATNLTYPGIDKAMLNPPWGH